jgi:hypothetical protein
LLPRTKPGWSVYYNSCGVKAACNDDDGAGGAREIIGGYCHFVDMVVSYQTSVEYY